MFKHDELIYDLLCDMIWYACVYICEGKKGFF